MPKSNNEEGVKCPFYIKMDYKSITCEGITDDCKLRLLFVSSECKELQRRLFCSKKYENCEVYAMLESKYDD